METSFHASELQVPGDVQRGGSVFLHMKDHVPVNLRRGMAEDGIVSVIVVSRLCYCVVRLMAMLMSYTSADDDARYDWLPGRPLLVAFPTFPFPMRKEQRCLGLFDRGQVSGQLPLQQPLLPLRSLC